MAKKKKEEVEEEYEEFEDDEDSEEEQEYVDESPDEKDFSAIEKEAGNMQIQLDTSDLLEGIRRDLRGYFINEKGKKINIGTQEMDDEHIDLVMNVLRTELNPHAALTDLTDEEISFMSEDLALQLLPIFYTAKMQPELKIPKVKMIRRLVHKQLKKNKRAMMIKTLNENVQVSEERKPIEQPQRFSIPTIIRRR